MVIKNKSVSLLWELNSNFSGKFFKKLFIVLTIIMAVFSRGCHPRIAHIRYIKFKHDSEAFWSFFYSWFGLLELKSLLGNTDNGVVKNLQYCPYSLGIMLGF